MQPKSRVEMDEQSFDILKRTIKNVIIPHRRRKLDPAFKTELPEVIGIKMTNRCNLRCVHCYQWNESGYHHEMTKAEQNSDLDIAIFERLLKETEEVKSRLYLWGGEPFFHRQIDRVLELLAANPRETTICTNAYLLDKHMDALCRLPSTFELLIAIEGFEKEHDLLRGKGSFNKVWEQVDKLMKLRAEGRFKGKISVHSMINDGMIGKLYELMSFFEEKGIDLVMLCFPWYISHETSREMDFFFEENFHWLNKSEDQRKSSWHAFKYHLREENIDALMADLTAINNRVWKTRIRYQPGLDFDEIEPFVRGEAMTSRSGSTCLALSTRADVMPSGEVVACKFFSEISVGNLQEQSLHGLWHSESYNKIRETLDKQLSPACSKCSVMYLHGASSMMHI